MAYNERFMFISIKHGNKKFLEVFNDFQGREIYHSLLVLHLTLGARLECIFKTLAKFHNNFHCNIYLCFSLSIFTFRTNVHFLEQVDTYMEAILNCFIKWTLSLYSSHILVNQFSELVNFLKLLTIRMLKTVKD